LIRSRAASSNASALAISWLPSKGSMVGQPMFKRWVFVGLAVGALVGPIAARADDEPSDPLEGLNRGVQAFNDTADRWVLKPAAKGYRKVLPQTIRTGVGNFFQNLKYPVVIVNQFLQGKIGLGMSDTGRFLMNTTLGLGGLFDPASHAGMPEHDEDFGQTFATWGIGRGPYIVIPLLGPSTVRDGVGSLLNFTVTPTGYITDDNTRYSLLALYVVQARAGVLDAEKLITGDRYIFMRDAYLQRREYLNKDGEVEDEFLDEDWEE
jgi:phospholipid-binding lipoprotein MlaA